MVNVKIYTSMLCGYCYRAKSLLKSKGIKFDEIDVTMNLQSRREMREKARGRTAVPQIFIGDSHIGGCDELYALEAEGQLDQLLAG